MSIPKPYKRPFVDLDRGKKRAWRNIQVEKVQLGDIIPDFGSVEQVHFKYAGKVAFTNKEGLEKDYPSGDTVFAFTLEES